MAKMELLPMSNLGYSHLDRLKTVVQANKQNDITVEDLEKFLNDFHGEPDKLKEFKEDLTHLSLALEGKILEKLSNPKPEILHVQVPVVENTYTTKELCEILNVSKQTVGYWITKDWLKAEQGMAAGKYHIKQSEIVKFLNKEGKKYLKSWNNYMSKL